MSEGGKCVTLGGRERAMTSGHRQRTTIGRGRCTAQTTSRDTVNKSQKATDDDDDDDDDQI